MEEVGVVGVLPFNEGGCVTFWDTGEETEAAFGFFAEGFKDEVAMDLSAVDCCSCDCCCDCCGGC